MGISRDWYHKRRLTGGKMPYVRKKRKFCLGRQPALTKLGTKLVRPVRVRGGAIKQRALRLETGNFSWGSEAIARKTRVLGVVYNASNNELVRTNTLVKGCIVQIDATPFRQFYMQHYGIELGKKKAAAEGGEEGDAAAAPVEAAETVQKRSNSVMKKVNARARTAKLEQAVEDEFLSGRLFAKVSSRPGQCGRVDGFILEGRELEFYTKALSKKKKSGK